MLKDNRAGGASVGGRREVTPVNGCHLNSATDTTSGEEDFAFKPHESIHSM